MSPHIIRLLCGGKVLDDFNLYSTTIFPQLTLLSSGEMKNLCNTFSSTNKETDCSDMLLDISRLGGCCVV